MDQSVEAHVAPEATRDRGWQRRLLPLMVRMIVVLALFFFAVTLGQLTYLHLELTQPKESRIPASAAQLVDQSRPFEGDREAMQLGLAALLESEAMARRYEMAGVVLSAHIWIRYLGFVTGMIMAIIGSVFILGKLRDPESSQLSAESKGAKVSLTSASPGLVLATLGVALIVVTVLAQQETKVTDEPLYAPFHEGRQDAPIVTDFFRPEQSSEEQTEGEKQ